MTQYSGKIIRKTPVVPSQVSASGVWTLEDAAAATKNNTWPVAGVPNPISRSVRFRASASAYFNRTPATASNQKTWTWSGWCKRGLLSSGQALFSAWDGSAGQQGAIQLQSGDILQVYTGGNAGSRGDAYTSAVFRDVSAWYHVVVVMNTTLATATDRIKIYINGVQQTVTFTVQPPQNTDGQINAAISHKLGSLSGATYFDGYLTEINFIDGQALTPSSFGTTDAATGAWVPMPYTGTYGTNGFYLNFKDNTSTTTLGVDYSGNSNHWTPTNISLTAGATYDSMVDVPTLWRPYTTTAEDVGAAVRGNYCTLNSLKTTGVAGTYSNANLTGSLSTDGTIFGTFAVSSGKWYWEITPTASTGAATTNNVIGVSKIEATVSYAGNTTDGFVYRIDGNKYTNSVASAYGASWALNDNIGVALDMDAGTVTFYKNGVSQGTAFTGLSGNFAPVVGNGNTTTTKTWDANFGQRPFTYTPPSGFKTLNTFNLPDATIKKGNAFFDATTYTGNGTSQSIVNSGGMQPDFVWIKTRSVARDHRLIDSVRGATNELYSNLTFAAATDAAGLTAFNSNGFTVGASLGYNNTGETLIGWQWNAGGATIANTAGSITSQVRASPTSGFSIVTYTGTGANATVGHGLGVAPNMVIVKNRSQVYAWRAWHTNLTGGTYYLTLNATDAQATSATIFTAVPTSTVFNVGTDNSTNGSTHNMVAYCFAEVAGFSKIGTWQNNNSTDGTFVYLGFRPRFIILKNYDNVEGWFIWDSARQTYNMAPPSNNWLLPNAGNAEGVNNASTAEIDGLSNGFKIRTTNPAAGEVSFGTRNYIFMAFAEYPFKNSNAR